jgi:hypothetical protein
LFLCPPNTFSQLPEHVSWLLLFSLKNIAYQFVYRTTWRDGRRAVLQDGERQEPDRDN